MKRISLLKERQASAASLGQITATGSHCPASGLWSPECDPKNVLSVFEGHVFPAFDGEPTVWRRVSAGVTSPN